MAHVWLMGIRRDGCIDIQPRAQRTRTADTHLVVRHNEQLSVLLLWYAQPVSNNAFQLEMYRCTNPVFWNIKDMLARPPCMLSATMQMVACTCQGWAMIVELVR